jgi:membrane protease YdiL (CAAX protease family)
VLATYGKTSAIVISAALFALMHTNIEQLLYTFVAGLFFGWIYMETGSLKAPILLHFVNNAVSAVGDIISQNASPLIWELYSSITIIAILVFGLISAVGFLMYIRSNGMRFGEKIKMKSDENGNEVLPLTFSEKLSGFFSVGMLIYLTYCVLIMSYLIYLSTKL